jgi:hypothetical protein
MQHPPILALQEQLAFKRLNMERGADDEDSGVGHLFCTANLRLGHLCLVYYVTFTFS